ncbi:hypothetical protein [Bizionia myxarmorum]|uniref:Uncharacterized protein n=1 Tax=Bizionia myxarmorum TaxID=291186 RepID=A0A5D0RCQ3_9FLAO|nr:hypothetical protein [Bizionia myxarmorum]TYB79450.1 hypothetical protein ES674_06720 [Bizionia myxarmorum]
MKNQLKAILVIFAFVFISACSSDANSTDETNQSDKLFSKMDFDDLDLNINFNDSKSIVLKVDSFSKQVLDANNVVEAINKINNQLDFRAKNDANFYGCSYRIIANNKEVIIKDFILDDVTDGSMTESNKTDTGGPAAPPVWDCPDGMSVVDVCWSEDCVADAVGGILSQMENGDIVNFVVHHGGLLGGMSICVK